MFINVLALLKYLLIQHVIEKGTYRFIKPGESLGSYYGYDVLDVWQEKDDFSTTQTSVKPGDLKYKDQNGDKAITDADRVILGKAFPDYF